MLSPAVHGREADAARRGGVAGSGGRDMMVMAGAVLGGAQGWLLLTAEVVYSLPVWLSVCVRWVSQPRHVLCPAFTWNLFVCLLFESFSLFPFSTFTSVYLL